MTIQTVYKVVRVIVKANRTGMYSCNSCHDIPGVGLVYKLFEKRKPTIPNSLLFAFDSKESARYFASCEFAGSANYWLVLRCDAEVLDLDTRPTKILLYHKTRKAVVNFWSQEFEYARSYPDRITVDLCPAGTVLCRWITPREIVYDSEDHKL